MGGLFNKTTKSQEQQNTQQTQSGSSAFDNSQQVRTVLDDQGQNVLQSLMGTITGQNLNPYMQTAADYFQGTMNEGVPALSQNIMAQLPGQIAGLKSQFLNRPQSALDSSVNDTVARAALQGAVAEQGAKDAAAQGLSNLGVAQFSGANSLGAQTLGTLAGKNISAAGTSNTDQSLSGTTNKTGKTTQSDPLGALMGIGGLLSMI
jgi:hypothetical protein